MNNMIPWVRTKQTSHFLFLLISRIFLLLCTKPFDFHRLIFLFVKCSESSPEFSNDAMALHSWSTWSSSSPEGCLTGAE